MSTELEERSMQIDDLPVAVVGAGPVGLAAAAHLHERDVPFVVLEAGDDVAAAVRDWSHVRLFSPWRFDVDPAAARLLEGAGWAPPDPDEHPTGGELVERYLRPLAALPTIAARLRTGLRVTSVTRAGLDKLRTAGRELAPFVVTAESRHGVERILARAVIDATGTWGQPNPVGAAGRPADGEDEAGHGLVRGVPDVAGAHRHHYAGRRVAVVGAGHSAQHAVRDLARLADEEPGTEITWIVRRTEAGAMFGGGSDDQLPERGRLGADARALVSGGRVTLVTGFRTAEVRTTGDGLVLVAEDGRRLGPYHRVVAATGARPDLRLLSELRVDVDPVLERARALAPLIDPNVHSCGSVPPHGAAELAHPEPGLYLVGAKSYGRAPTFLLATGYEQVRSVVAALAGDAAAAADVRLVLPETGVCSLDALDRDGAVGRQPEPAGCCAPQPVAVSGAAQACCG